MKGGGWVDAPTAEMVLPALPLALLPLRTTTTMVTCIIISSSERCDCWSFCTAFSIVEPVFTDVRASITSTCDTLKGCVERCAKLAGRRRIESRAHLLFDAQ